MAQSTPSQPVQTVSRLPWLALLMGLLAIAALCVREGSLLSPLVPLAVALPASRYSTHRIEQASQLWMLRALLFICVVALGMARSFPDTSGLYDPRIDCLAGELLTVEMVLQAWRQRPAGGSGYGGMLIALSGLILLTAADSTEDRAIWFLAPAYTLCLALALPGFRAQSQEPAVSPYRRSPAAWIALALALAFGATTHIAFRVHQQELTEWGMQMLHEARVAQTGSGALSTSPSLGASYGLQGSDERSYRIDGPPGGDLPDHLRVMAFDTYSGRTWLPLESVRQARSEAAQLLPRAQSPRWRVTRLIANNGLLAAPLETSGFDADQQRGLSWAPEMGPLKSEAPIPSSYGISVGLMGSQGIFCAPPDAAERMRLLALPRELDPKVGDLARRIGGDATTPEAKAEAVVAYLPAHHGYSLSYRPGSGDPISRFLLSSSAAHCEYFGSAAVILLRCLGVPARYVIGYYAHERDMAGHIVVRQRDAHAWAEAWIDGKGWITLDATPGDGRPDKTGGAAWWTRLTEWLSDSIADLRGRLGRIGMIVLFAVAGCALLLIAWRNRPRRVPQEANPALSYSTASEELALLALRFERVARRIGLALPPNRTWEEALDALLSAPAGTAVPLDPEATRLFVRAYNAARWGGANAQEIERLKTMLQAIENRSGSAGKLQEPSPP